MVASFDAISQAALSDLQGQDSKTANAQQGFPGMPHAACRSEGRPFGPVSGARLASLARTVQTVDASVMKRLESQSSSRPGGNNGAVRCSLGLLAARSDAVRIGHGSG